jgi:hypothetical protein
MNAWKHIKEHHRPDGDELEALVLAKPRRLLVVAGGRAQLTCPGCGQAQDILAYKPFAYNEDFADELIPPLLCGCGHIFALAPSTEGVE